MKRTIMMLAVLAFAFSFAVRAAEYTFTLACHVSDESVLSQSFHKFAKDVAEKSGGRLQINVSTAAALGGQREIVENVNLGAIEIGMGESGIYTNYIPAFGVMVLPFMHESKEKFYEAVDGKVGKRLEEMMAAQTNMRILAWLDGGGTRDVYSLKPIKSIEEMRGVKIRTPESAAFVTMFKAFNANPTAISAPEMYTALQQGVVDAMEGTYETAVTYGIVELAKNCLETHHIYNESSLVVNKDAFAELPADLQQVLLDCAEKLERDERALNDELLGKFKQRMLDAKVVFTPVDMEKAKAMVAGVYKEYIGNDASKQEIFDLLTGAK